MTFFSQDFESITSVQFFQAVLVQDSWNLGLVDGGNDSGFLSQESAMTWNLNKIRVKIAWTVRTVMWTVSIRYLVMDMHIIGHF